MYLFKSRINFLIFIVNIIMQFGVKLFFENIFVKFGGGNCYGFIGVNGCGKFMFMKIFDGSLIVMFGNVLIIFNE